MLLLNHYFLFLLVNPTMQRVLRKNKKRKDGIEGVYC